MHIIFFFSGAAPPTVHEAELPVAASSSLSFAGVVVNEAELPVSAASALTFEAELIDEAELPVSAASTLSFTALVDRFAQLPVAASSTLAFEAELIDEAALQVAASSTISFEAVVVVPAQEAELDVDVVSSITFAAVVVNEAQLPVAASSTLAFEAELIDEAELDVDVVSSLSFTALVDRFAQLPVAVVSTIGFSATLIVEAAMAVASTSSLEFNARVDRLAAFSVSASSEISFAASGDGPTFTVAGQSAISFAATKVIDAALTISESSTIDFAAEVEYNAAFVVSADSTLAFTATLPQYLFWRFYFTNTTLNVSNTILPHTRQNWKIECEVAFAAVVNNRSTTYLASNNPAYTTGAWSLRLVRNATTGLLELHGNCGTYHAVLPLADQRHLVWHKYAIEWEGGTRLRLLVDDVPGEWLDCSIPSHTGNVFTWGWNSLRTGSYGFSLSGFMTNMKAYRDGTLRGHWMMGEGSPQPPLSTEEEVTLVQTPVTAGTGYWVQLSSIVVEAQLGISGSSSFSFVAEESAKFAVAAVSTITFDGTIIGPPPPPYLHQGELLVPATSSVSFAATVLHQPFTEFTIDAHSSFSFAAQIVADPEPPGGSIGLQPIEVVPIEAEDRVIETGVTPRRIRCLSRLR